MGRRSKDYMHDNISLKEWGKNYVLMYHFLIVHWSSCNSMVMLVSLGSWFWCENPIAHTTKEHKKQVIGWLKFKLARHWLWSWWINKSLVTTFSSWNASKFVKSLQLLICKWLSSVSNGDCLLLVLSVGAFLFYRKIFFNCVKYIGAC
jgi:hypothetical protein